MNAVPEPNICRSSLRIGAEEFAFMGDNRTTSETEAAMLAAVSLTGGLIISAEALALYRICQRLPAGARVLEVGSYLGASTTAMGHAVLGRGIEMYCLDCWHDYQGQGFFEHALAGTAVTDRDILSRFLKNTGFLGEQLRVLKGTSIRFSDLLPTGFFDLIFIDAAHDYENVKQDIRIAFRAIKPGGIICGHDYHSDGDGVREAVNQLIADADDIHIKGVIKGTSIWYSVIEAVRH